MNTVIVTSAGGSNIIEKRGKHAKYMREWKKKHPEYYKERSKKYYYNHKKYYEKNKGKINAQKKIYYQNHKEYLLAKGKEWRERNKSKIKENRQKNREKTREQERIRSEKLRLDILIHYSGNPPKCQCCGESNIAFLTIDHINGGGCKRRREFAHTGRHLYNWMIKNNYPKEYQILCFNCNCGRAKNNGVCPHKTEIA